jgi:hypothetical protein
MNDADVLAYVKAAAHLLDLPLDETRAHAVAVHLARTSAMARQLDTFAMPLELEACEVFCPAPFPAVEPAPAAT